MAPDQPIVDAFKSVSTATLTTVLFRMGLKNVWLRGPRPLVAGQDRVAGRAFTLRFVPLREDLSAQGNTSSNSNRAAVESMPEGCVCVAGAPGATDVGIFGDILCARMQRRGVAALVTDGALRDGDGIGATGLPSWSAGVASAPWMTRLSFIGWQQTVECGGVTIVPGDFIVADGDGVVVVPAAMASQVAESALDQERLESWVLKEVNAGQGLIGLYPPDASNRTRFESERGPRK